MYFKIKSVADQYDNYISQSIPFYDAVFAFVADALKKRFGERPIIMADIGCGTGNISAFCRGVCNISHVHLLDFSAAMLDIAQDKLSDIATTRHEQSFTDPFRMKDLDVVVASLTLDHMEHLDSLTAVYQSMYDTLKDGGTCIVIEKCCDSSDKSCASWKAFNTMIQIRKKHMLQNKLKTAAEADSWENHIFTEDFLRPLSVLYDIAKSVGFDVQLTGVPVTSDMTYESFYDMKAPPLQLVEDRPDNDVAHGMGVLLLTKKSRL